MKLKVLLSGILGSLFVLPAVVFSSNVAKTIDMTFEVQNMNCGEDLTINLDSNNGAHFYANTGDYSWQNNRVSISSGNEQPISISHFQVDAQSLMVSLSCSNENSTESSFNINLPMTIVDDVQLDPESPPGTRIKAVSDQIFGTTVILNGSEPQILEVNQK